MNDRVAAGDLDTPWTWFVTFHPSARTGWLNRVIPGRLKHVSAFGYSSRTGTWVFYDPSFERTWLSMIADGDEAVAVIARWIRDAVVVEMHVPPRQVRRWRPGGWCVPAIAHLIGLRSGAVFPSGLLRDCLRNGGRIIQDAFPQPEAD